jgi:hypothetical protein
MKRRMRLPPATAVCFKSISDSRCMMLCTPRLFTRSRQRAVTLRRANFLSGDASEGKTNQRRSNYPGRRAQIPSFEPVLRYALCRASVVLSSRTARVEARARAIGGQVSDRECARRFLIEGRNQLGAPRDMVVTQRFCHSVVQRYYCVSVCAQLPPQKHCCCPSAAIAPGQHRSSSKSEAL